MSEQIALPAHRMTRQEFYAWVERQPGGDFELLDGQVTAMAPERAIHGKVKLRAANALEAAIRAGRLACEVYLDSLAVEVGDNTSYKPDVVVNRGSPVDDNSVVAPSPVIVVEVTSPSTSRADHSTKFADYMRLPSLRHYLIVNLTKRLVIHHHRNALGVVESRLIASGALALDPPGITIAVEQLLGDNPSTRD